ncbi:topoisomerase [Sporosarcina jeotgali]|uniref:Topoisomerase n=1 Tax=Sporosarcina jeotgali TaxID=3020056 RepID=A0ABZ0KU58_9BACL|nr:topoisomerase [Sporosarcina sp. B2O-1]WOV83006.1 topoisomerase [Sporosarcina sp. B2O-1]
MIKKAIISGVLFSSIFLVGCNGEPEVVVLEDSENEENDADLSSELNLVSELKSEVITSITEQTELDKESIAIMVDGNVKDMTVSVSYPKDVKVDETMIQQAVEDSIKKVSEAENATISEEDITIKIEKY